MLRLKAHRTSHLPTLAYPYALQFLWTLSNMFTLTPQLPPKKKKEEKYANIKSDIYLYFT